MHSEDLAKFNKILIVGYGLEGRSAEAFIRKTFPNMEIGIADQKDGPDYLAKQSDYELAVKSPGVNKKLITIPYTTPTNLFFANAQAPIIGVTGTKGKSTTTSLVHAMLKEGGYDARLCGNIGKPMLDQPLEPVGDKTVYVCELSSYQLDDIKYSPHKALFINLFPEHMDFHGSFEAYKEAKQNIAKFMTLKDDLVYNAKSSELVDFAKHVSANKVKVVEDMPFKFETTLLGEHNIENIKSAYTVAKLMNVSDDDVARAIKNFKPLSHRLEIVGTFKGVSFYDDAISTTPESTIQALEAIPNINTIFLGGTDRGYDFKELAAKVIEKGVRNAVFFPDSGVKIKSELLKLIPADYELQTLETRDMELAVRWAYEHTRQGSNCILSCASPSYSIWKNFEEKGDLFKKFVREIGSE